MSQREGQNIFIKTFGGFDVFVDGKQVHFSSEKAKEMLAVLVDKRVREGAAYPYHRWPGCCMNSHRNRPPKIIFG